MARLRVVSDLHLEFQIDDGVSRLRTVAGEPDDFDVMVVAGDLANFRSLAEGLIRLTMLVQKPIVYVLGNHEGYGASYQHALQLARRVAAHQPHLHVLEREAIQLEGVRFVGATLWFPYEGPRSTDDYLSDFKAVAGLRSWLGEYAEASERSLEQLVDADTVVVTHHMPHPKSIHPKYQGNALNPYFLHDMSHLIERAKPKLWIHGHTHEPCDYHVGPTRIVCNPAGYPGERKGDWYAPLDLELT